MPDVSIALLGVPHVAYQGHTVTIHRRKALALLAYLAVEQRPQSRDTLAALLWPDLDHDGARAALRSTLPALTQLIPIPWLQIDRTMLALRSDAVTVDIREVRELLNRARMHGEQTPNAAVLALLQSAVALYRGPLMSGFTLNDCAEYDLWQAAQQERLQREIVAALRSLTLAYGDHGPTREAAIGYARRWLELEPLDEEAHRALMRLYAAGGLRAEALRQYQKCVALIDAELATPPEPATTRLAEQIKRGELLMQPTPPQHRESGARLGDLLPPPPPLVVGREQALKDLRTRLGSSRRSITVIQGWPGVGKSTTAASLARDPELAGSFPDGVLWASLGEQPDLPAILNAWAAALGLDRSARPSPPDETAQQISVALRDRRILLILDDVWSAEHFRLLNVGGHHAALVLTTRLNEVAQQLAPLPNDIYRLGVLSETAGLKLLEALAPEAVQDYPDEARRLVHDLEGLPLAIQVAGRLLHNELRFGWGIDDLLAELREGRRLLEASLPGAMLDLRRTTTPTITALLQRSTDALEPQIRERFAYLGLFVPKPATFDLAAMAIAWNLGDPRPTARILVNRGLLEPIGGGRFQMHALLVLYARALIGSAA